MQPSQWHAETVDSTIRQLGAHAVRGLSSDEAKKRLARYGPNRLPEGDRKHPLALFFAQFSDFMVLVLLGAGIVSFFLGEVVDSLAIVAILLVNAIFGFVQEFRAEKSLQALSRLTAPKAMVVRDGETMEIPAAELVPGDLVLVRDGDRIAADGRLLWSMSLEVDESLLTGESMPVAKDAFYVGRKDEPVGDRKNMLFMGTAVTRGRGRLLVTGTGTRTQIGEIARLIQHGEEAPSPLQQRLAHLGKRLVAACFLLVALVFVAGVLRGLPMYSMFLTGVSLSVAAIPEGLPAVVTAALAIGVQRMIRRQAIVRRLPAVETLGCVTVICTDKTGTLTRNEMTVTRLWTFGREVEVTGTGYKPSGDFLERGRPVDPKRDRNLQLALEIGMVCNAATLTREGQEGVKQRESADWRVLGDPTDGALLVLGAKAGLDVNELRRRIPTVMEHPFDPMRRRMSVVAGASGALRSYVKGAPGAILDQCTHIQVGERVEVLTNGQRRRVEEQVKTYATNALRVIALAYRAVPAGNTGTQPWEDGLTFVALAGLFDPPRDEATRAIAKARRAGIRTIMLTGDHPATAQAISRLVGLSGGGEKVVTGTEVDAMDDQSLREVLRQVSCFARVSPVQKLRIVRALKAAGELVAMTGDGVNDAPAVKEADIGIAMGRTGADVTKEASDMVLADDNYATIVAAVEEGRAIYENIRKFIRYLLGCNAGEVLTMLAALLVGLPLPLLPLQILWMNLVTDGLPAIALGVDPGDDHIMQRGPRPVREGIFARNLWKRILLSGAFIGGSTVLIFAVALWLRPGMEDWARTMAFTTLVFSQLLYAFVCRSEELTVWQAGPFVNRYLVGAVLVSFAMQLAVIYWGPLAAVFRTVPLTAEDWILVVLASSWGYAAEWFARLLRTRLWRRFAWVRVS